MQKREAIVLAGGMGTRLRSAVPDLPKCMAPIAGRPFIDYVISHYQDAGIGRFVFALGYMHQAILDHLSSVWHTLDYDYCIEQEPLGTGGAIALASQKINGQHCAVLNGDTLYKIDILDQFDIHFLNDALITVAVKPMENFDRYGTIILNDNGCITAFEEKKKSIAGLINGGIYVVNLQKFSALNLPIKFSFEKEVLEAQVTSGSIFGKVYDDYFIDIGVPEDFEKAGRELQFF